MGKLDSFNSVHTELGTVGKSRGGRQYRRHGLNRGELRGPGGDLTEFLGHHALSIHLVDPIVACKDHGAGTAFEFTIDLGDNFRAPVGGHSCRVTIEGDGGGGRILCNHLDGFSNGNIIPLHIDLPLDCDKPCFLIHHGVGASSFYGDGKAAV